MNMKLHQEYIVLLLLPSTYNVNNISQSSSKQQTFMRRQKPQTLRCWLKRGPMVIRLVCKSAEVAAQHQ